jgi:hypothetical protein
LRKDLQEALESAVAEFEKRQQAKQERLRERERFETDWARIRTAVVLPALEEVAVLLRKAGWQCEVRAGDKDPGVHFTVYRGATTGASGGEKKPSLILIAFDTYATTYRSWSGLQILPLGAFRKLILPPIRRRQDEWQQTIYPARFPLE